MIKSKEEVELEVMSYNIQGDIIDKKTIDCFLLSMKSDNWDILVTGYNI